MVLLLQVDAAVDYFNSGLGIDSECQLAVSTRMALNQGRAEHVITIAAV